MVKRRIRPYNLYRGTLKEAGIAQSRLAATLVMIGSSVKRTDPIGYATRVSLSESPSYYCYSLYTNVLSVLGAS